MLTLAGFGAVFTALWGRDIARKRRVIVDPGGAPAIAPR